MRHSLALLLVLLCLSAFFARVQAEPVDMNHVAATLAEKGDVLVSVYSPASGETLGDGFSDLYFGVFEGLGMETEIGAVNAGLKADLEAQFSAIIGMAYRGAPAVDVNAQWQRLRADLLATARNLTHEGKRDGNAVLVQALTIMLREGGEAAVVLGALVACVRRMRVPRAERLIQYGAASALVASIATAAGMSVLRGAAGPMHEAIEGMALLLSALMLAYMSHWLWFQRDGVARNAKIEASVEAFAKSGRLFPLAAASFLAVYREGAETAMFYQVLLVGPDGSGMMVALGATLGAMGLAAVYLAYRLFPVSLPPPAFLALTAVPLFVLSMVFAGRGMFALQGAGLMSATALPLGPAVVWLGFFPTLEGVLVQAVVLVMLLPIPLFLMRRRMRLRTSG